MTPEGWNYAVGVALLALVVCLWDVSAFLTNLMEVGESDGPVDQVWRKPFAVTWLSTIGFSLYLIPHAISAISTKEADPQIQDETEGLLENAAGKTDRLTTRETAWLGLYFVGLWICANWALAAALAFTSVSSSVILASTSGFFTLVFGAVFGFNRLTVARFMAVLLSLIGVILVSKADNDVTPIEDRRKTAIYGDALALFSALLYAAYVSLLKLGIKEEHRIDMKLFFGFVGIISLFTLWPIFILLHYTGLETFELPTSRTVVLGLLANSAITVVSDYMYVIALLRTSPLLVTVGVSMTIPVAIVGDILKGSTTVASFQALFGAALVLSGFAFVGFADKEETEKD